MNDDDPSTKRAIIPLSTVAVTIGIDTQSDGFFYLLACWGRKMEVWLPLTGRLVGDMRSLEVWEALTELLATQWLDRDGNGYKPVRSAIDTGGDYYPEVLAYIKTIGARLRLRGVRGLGIDKSRTSAGRGFGLVRNSYVDKSTRVTVTNIDTDIAKTTIANLLARKEPGPGYVNLPSGAHGEEVGGWDRDAIDELTAEYRRESHVAGYTVTRWHKYPSRANHRLDCFVYALGALALSRLKLDDCPLQRTEAREVKSLVNLSPDSPKKEAPSPFGVLPSSRGAEWKPLPL
jgi:phage terminase large subunit GpA-like protein